MPPVVRAASVTASLSVGLAVAAWGQAAGPKGSIRGTVYDSLVASGPLGGATVELIELNRIATTDARGVFRFDSVPGGKYTIAFSHPSLAAIGFAPPDRPVELGAGIDIGLALGTPSPATIYRLLCPGVREATTGLLLGTLADAATGQPIVGGEVRGEWQETTISRAAGFNKRSRMVRAAADQTGRFRLCGIPTDVTVLLRTIVGGREGSPLELKLDGRPLAVRHLSATSDTASRGPGRVAGRVTAGGSGLADAQVLVVGTDRITRTAADGSFTLDGLPLGSHTVEARALGFTRKRAGVDLRATAPAELAFDLARTPVELPELKVTATAGAAARNGFEQRRRLATGGYFLTGEELVKRGTIRVEEAFRTIPGMRVTSAGLNDYRILSTRGGSGFAGECEPTVFIDGTRIPLDPDAGLSLPVVPQEVQGIEVHQGPGSAPIEYRSVGQNCGVILIWTKRGGR